MPVSAPRAPTVQGGALVPFWVRWIDRFAGSDPGLNRLRMALRAVLTIAAAVAVEGSSPISLKPCTSGRMAPRFTSRRAPRQRLDGKTSSEQAASQESPGARAAFPRYLTR
jgi:hypothetical protein